MTDSVGQLDLQVSHSHFLFRCQKREELDQLQRLNLELFMHGVPYILSLQGSTANYPRFRGSTATTAVRMTRKFHGFFLHFCASEHEDIVPCPWIVF